MNNQSVTAFQLVSFQNSNGSSVLGVTSLLGSKARLVSPEIFRHFAGNKITLIQVLDEHNFFRERLLNGSNKYGKPLLAPGH